MRAILLIYINARKWYMVYGADRKIPGTVAGWCWPIAAMPIEEPWRKAHSGAGPSGRLVGIRRPYRQRTQRADRRHQERSAERARVAGVDRGHLRLGTESKTGSGVPAPTAAPGLTSRGRYGKHLDAYSDPHDVRRASPWRAGAVQCAGGFTHRRRTQAVAGRFHT